MISLVDPVTSLTIMESNLDRLHPHPSRRRRLLLGLAVVPLVVTHRRTRGVQVVAFNLSMSLRSWLLKRLSGLSLSWTVRFVP